MCGCFLLIVCFDLYRLLFSLCFPLFVGVSFVCVTSVVNYLICLLILLLCYLGLLCFACFVFSLDWIFIGLRVFVEFVYDLFV